MADRLPTLAQPPIVWGPSEINEWIRESFPTNAKGGPKPLARKVRRLTVKVWSDSLPSVRSRVVLAVGALGYRTKREEKLPLVSTKGERTIRVRFHPSLLGDAISVVADFSPPASSSTPKRIANALGDQFALGKVTMTKAPRERVEPHRRRRRAAKR